MTLSLHPPLRACWMRRGQQKRIPTPGQPRQHHLIGGYEWDANRITALPTPVKNSEAFIAFLEELLLNQYPDDFVILVLDNASIHKSATTLAALSLFEHRVLVVWLPPYCSTLNPIERYWRHLKEQACVNKLFPDLPDLLAAVEITLVAQNNLDNPNRFTFLSFTR